MTPKQIEKLNLIIGNLKGLLNYFAFKTSSFKIIETLKQIVEQLEQLRDENGKN